MSASYRLNEERKGIEITFSEKPDAETLKTLKNQGFRWCRSGGYWYTRQSEKALELAQQVAAGERLEPAAGDPGRDPVETQESSARTWAAELRRLYGQIWPRSQKMVSYCVEQVAAVAALSAGEVVPISKQKIKTRFCFGESGYDADEARDEANNARTNADYLRRENLKDFEEKIRMLEEMQKERLPKWVAMIPKSVYYSQPEDNRLSAVAWRRPVEVIEACGGSVFPDELPGKVLDFSGQLMRYPTDADIAELLRAYREAYKAHVKKVDAYIKRYGTSKVHAWTYWRDA